MATTSANTLIERAMVKARIIYPGESIPSGKATQVLNELNDMLESWALEGLMVLYNTVENFSLVIGTSEYTYGTGGAFNSARPTRILDESFIRSGGYDFPVKLYPLDTFRRRTNKSTQGRPEIISYIPEYPLGKVYLWPTPDSTDALYVRATKEIASFATLATEVNLQLGYRRAIISNLALEILTNFGKKASAELVALASQSKKVIKSYNKTSKKLLSSPDLVSMVRGGGRYNILSGS